MPFSHKTETNSDTGRFIIPIHYPYWILKRGQSRVAGEFSHLPAYGTRNTRQLLLSYANRKTLMWITDKWPLHGPPTTALLHMYIINCLPAATKERCIYRNLHIGRFQPVNYRGIHIAYKGFPYRGFYLKFYWGFWC